MNNAIFEGSQSSVLIGAQSNSNLCSETDIYKLPEQYLIFQTVRESSQPY